MREDTRSGRGKPAGGVPDGLVIGVLALLLGLTVLTWTATGLAGLLAKGAWPDHVTLPNSPEAIRHLMGQPHDLTGAWPTTPAEQLTGYGLFWGLFIGQMMVLVVVTVFIMGTFTRWRTVRAGKRAAARKSRQHKENQKDLAYEHEARTAAEQAYDRGRTKPHPSASPDQPPYTEADFARQRAELERDRAIFERERAEAALERERAERGRGLRDRGESAGTGATGLGSTGVQGSCSPGTDGEAASDGAAGVRAASGEATDCGATEDLAPGARATANRAAGVPVANAPEVGVPGAGVPEPTTPGYPPLPAPRSPLILGPADTRRPAAVQAVQDAEGPALVLTSDATLWAETKDARAKLGPVLVYDPVRLCDTPARLHWSPTRGCESRTVAAHRATALLAPVRPTARIDATLADTAETLLRSFLHAAAVDGRPFKHVHRWAQGTGVQEAVRILRTHTKAAPGSAGELEAALTGYPERRDMAQELTTRCLAALSTVHIRESCTPNRADSLALDSFVTEGGTLYLVGEPIEDPKSHPGAMPLLTALASSVVEHGRSMAARSSSGRLDPPLTLVLDNVAAVAPLPQLPALLTNGVDQGLPTLALLRSQEQARSRWPNAQLPF